MDRSRLPRIAITLGDPTGVGPEIIVKAIVDGDIQEQCLPMVVGRKAILIRAAERSHIDCLVQSVDSMEQAVEVIENANALGHKIVACLEASDSCVDEAIIPCIDARGGKAAYDCLLRATELCLQGEVDAIVTAPLQKLALHQAGHHWPGHTELLAHLCGAKESAMMLYLPPGKPRHGGDAGLGVVHVTLHMALRDIFQHITIDSIGEKVQLAHDFFSKIKNAMQLNGLPRIAVTALNPHAGEGGRFGSEEHDLIQPAVEIMAAKGILVSGPHATDTLMPRAASGEFDCVVAMYHDQGHIALKLLDMFEAVNITLGLPIIRTSVAHGTAHDIAWTNRANAGGMKQAILAAVRLVRGEHRASYT